MARYYNLAMKFLEILKRHKVLSTLLLALILVPLMGIIVFSTFLWTSTYTWMNGADPEIIKSAQFKPITKSRLSGFQVENIKENSRNCDSYDSYIFPGYLRQEGGLCTVDFWLEYTNADGTFNKADSMPQLKTAFAPVESEEEAMSFIAVTQSDLVSNNDILEGKTAKVGDDYFVIVKFKNTFSCGKHIPLNEIYKVTHDGDITAIARQEEMFTIDYYKPNQPTTCVD
jgi:hypothetical protein